MPLFDYPWPGQEFVELESTLLADNYADRLSIFVLIEYTYYRTNAD